MPDYPKDALSSDIEYLNGVAEGRSQANAQFRAKLECAEERIRQLEAQLDSAEQRGRAIERESILSYLEGWYCDDNAALDGPTTMREALVEVYEEILSGDHLVEDRVEDLLADLDGEDG